MTTTDGSPSAQQFAAAGALLETLAARDFAGLGTALEPDATLSALLPRGFCEWQGAAEIAGAFEGWFGDASEYEVVDTSVEQAGTRLRLRWRIRVCAPRHGDHAMVVEQHVYAETGASSRISTLSLLCSGFCKEQTAN